MRRLICWNCKRKYDGGCMGWVKDEDLGGEVCKGYVPIEKNKKTN